MQVLNLQSLPAAPFGLSSVILPLHGSVENVVAPYPDHDAGFAASVVIYIVLVLYNGMTEIYRYSYIYIVVPVLYAALHTFAIPNGAWNALDVLYSYEAQQET